MTTTQRPLPSTFQTRTSLQHPGRAPANLSPTTTLAHLYANVRAKNSSSTSSSSSSSSGSSMWSPQARPPLAHARSVQQGGGGGGRGGGSGLEGGGLPEELHAHYSMIAVVVLTALFFTVTLFATGLLLAFCKKTNTVFSLQKSDKDSNYELDDLEKTDDAEEGSCCHGEGGHLSEASSTTAAAAVPLGGATHRRSQTFPDLKVGEGSIPSHFQSTDNSHLTRSSDSGGSGAISSPLFATTTRSILRKTPKTDTNLCAAEVTPNSSSSFKRAVTMAAIHHSDPPTASTGAECSIQIHVEDVDAKSDTSDSSSAFAHLYLKLREEEDENEEEMREDENDDSDMDEVHHDQTRALLKCQ